MVYYPVFLDLRDRDVLVVGAGKVALRKVKGLLEAGARVTVVSPEAEPEFDTLAVEMRRRRFQKQDIAGNLLVFAATNDRAVNAEVREAAVSAGVQVNVADAPEECSFIVPARVRNGDLQIAVSTSRRSPRLAKQLRIRLEKVLMEYHQE